MRVGKVWEPLVYTNVQNVFNTDKHSILIEKFEDSCSFMVVMSYCYLF